MTCPSRLSRESTTRSSRPPQKGHFMPAGTRNRGLGTLGSRGYSPSFRGRGSRFRDIAKADTGRAEDQEDQTDAREEDERRRPRDEGDRSRRRSRHAEDVHERDLDGELVGAEPAGSRHGQPEHGGGRHDVGGGQRKREG